jgi:hypothetical protein
MKFNFIKNKKMENIYYYFLNYNIYTEEWNAILRNESNRYMGGVEDVVIFSNKDINKLIEKISSLEIIENV